MFRKFTPLWTIMALPLAVIMFSCGGDEIGPADSGSSSEDQFNTDWNITLQDSGTEGNLQEAFFVPNSSHGWVVGNGGIILHTADKGENWEQQDSGKTNNLYSVYFASEEEGWVVGDGGTVLHTADYGATWDGQTSGITQELRGVYFANISDGWAVGKAGMIIGTKDGGDSWGQQTSGTNQDLHAIDFAPPPPGEVVVDHGWAVGVGGTILRTTNGNVWGTQNAGLSGPKSLYGVFFATESKGWVSGDLGSTILTTSNGGTTWSDSSAAEALFGASNKNMYDLFFIDAADGWAVGAGGKVLHSPDGGTWDGIETEVTANISTPLWGVVFIDSTEGWAVGDAGVILHIKKVE